MNTDPESWSTRGHIRIPDKILARRDLSPPQKLILGLLGRFQGNKLGVQMAMPTIARLIGISERTAQRSIKTIPPADLKVTPQKKLSGFAAEICVHHDDPHLYEVTWANERNRDRIMASRRQRAEPANVQPIRVSKE